MKKTMLLLFILLLSSALWAQNRFALVIGNANYPRTDDKLPNTINDTNDISAALKELGYNTVTLRQNLKQRDMIREITAFLTQLKSNRNSEGFFWYAGHAMEINGVTYLLPIDVDTEDEEMLMATSYSISNMTRQLNEVRNKVNVLVLDACRVPPALGGGARSTGDTSRVLRTVPQLPPDLLLIYSTASGTVAYDGEGKRNSPFTEAFLKHIKSTEPLSLMIGHVTTDTMSLTGQRQRPYTSGSMGSENIYYSLNPAGGQVPAPNPPQPTQTYNIGDRGPAGGIIFYDKGKYTDGWRYLEAAPTDFPNEVRWSQNGGLSFYPSGHGRQITESIVAELQKEGFFASHASLPMNSRVTVTNENGDAIEVTVCDRMVASPSHIIGLSFNACQALGLEQGDIVVITISGFRQVGTAIQMEKWLTAAQLCVSYNLNGYYDWYLPSPDELEFMDRNLHQKGLGNFISTYYWSSFPNSPYSAQIHNFANGSWQEFTNVARVRAVRSF